KDPANHPGRNFALHCTAPRAAQNQSAIHTGRVRLRRNRRDERNSFLLKRDRVLFHESNKSADRQERQVSRTHLPSCRPRKERKTNLRSVLYIMRRCLSEFSPSPRAATVHSHLRSETAQS